MKYILAFIFFGLLLLAACAGPAASPPVREAENSPDITVFRSPT